MTTLDRLTTAALAPWWIVTTATTLAGYALLGPHTWPAIAATVPTLPAVWASRRPDVAPPPEPPTALQAAA